MKWSRRLKRQCQRFFYGNQTKKPTITLSGCCIHWAGAHCQLISEAIWNLWLEAPEPLSGRCGVPRGTFVLPGWSTPGPVPQWRTTLPHLVGRPIQSSSFYLFKQIRLSRPSRGSNSRPFCWVACELDTAVRDANRLRHRDLPKTLDSRLFPRKITVLDGFLVCTYMHIKKELAHENGGNRQKTEDRFCFGMTSLYGVRTLQSGVSANQKPPWENDSKT